MIRNDLKTEKEVSNLFNGIEKETKENINKKNMNLEEEIEELTDQSIFKTNQLLKEKGYRYNSTGLFCPFETNPQYYLRIGRNNNSYEYSIGLLSEDNEFESKTSKYYNTKPITVINNSREKELRNQVKININPEYDEESKPFPDGLLEKGLNRFSIELENVPDFEQITKDFKEYEERISKTNESEEEDIVETTVYSSFEEYPKKIRETAIKIIEEDKLFDNIINTVSIIHKGNTNLKESLVLVCGSVYIDEPVQTEISAKTGAGKTNIVLAVVDNYPVHHVKVLRTVSSKNIYYDKDSYNEDFNILVKDDVILNESNIETEKELTDNRKKVKELRTVNKEDGTNKAKTYTLKGSFLNIYTYAKTNPDEEFSDRLFKGFIEEDIDKSEVKRFIKRNSITKMKENHDLKVLNQINQCSIQWLIEKEVSVYNPFMLLLIPDEFNNRDISNFISLANAKTFYHYSKRRKITVKGKTVLLGTFEDYQYILERWDKDTQKYKLSERQKAILNMIPVYDSKEDFYEFVETKSEEYVNADSSGTKNLIKEELATITSLAKKLGINKQTLKLDIDGTTKGRNKKNLEELGLIEKVLLVENTNNSPYVYGRIKTDKEGEASISENSINTMDKNQMYSYFNALEVKRSILNYLIHLYNFSNIYKGGIFLNNFCSNYDKPITDYDSLCDFIEAFIEEFEDNVPEVDEIDIDNIFNNFNYLDETERYLYTYNSGFLYSQKETTETSSNAKSMPKSVLKSENINVISIENGKEAISEEIERISYNYPKIYSMIKGFLGKKGTVTKSSIFYNIAENYNTDPESEEFEHTIIQIDKTLRQMEENHEILKDYDKYSLVEGAVKQ